MKIYRQNHNIIEDRTIRHKDIPLSFLSNNEVKKNIKIEINEEVMKEETDGIPVMPYQDFESYNQYLFDANKNIVDVAGSMQRIGDTYYYIPENSIEYSPLRFNIKAIIKKNLTYETNRDYYIKAACIDNDNGLVNNLISVFGDAPARGICPNNIFVNNQDVAAESLINSNLYDNDFVFIDSNDGIEPQENLYENLLKENVNIWLSVNNIENIIEVSSKSSIDLRNPILYPNRKSYHNKYQKKIDASKEITFFPKDEYTTELLFSGEQPILLLKKENCGYVIISHKDLMKEIGENAKIFYEVLIHVFFNTYKNIKKSNMWISDNKIDRITGNASNHNLEHNKVSRKNIIKELKKKEIEENLNEVIKDGEYLIKKVETSSEYVKYLRISLDDTLMFEKDGPTLDPVKEKEMISVYTVRHTIINHKKNELNIIEQPIRINKIQNVFGDYLEIMPIKSTYLKMNIIRSQTIEIPRGKTDLVLSYKEGVFNLTENFEEETHGVKIANVRVEYDIEIKNYDIRVLGGGAIEGTQDEEYNLIDIGHAKGRPYRAGGCTVITLEKNLEQYKDQIEKEVKKHTVGGDLPIIIFK